MNTQARHNKLSKTATTQKTDKSVQMCQCVGICTQDPLSFHWSQLIFKSVSSYQHAGLCTYLIIIIYKIHFLFVNHNSYLRLLPPPQVHTHNTQFCCFPSHTPKHRQKRVTVAIWRGGRGEGGRREPSCTQHALRSLHMFKIHHPPFDRRRPKWPKA